MWWRSLPAVSQRQGLFGAMMLPRLSPPAALRSRKLSVGGWTSSPKTCQGRRSRALLLASPTPLSREVKGAKAGIPHARSVRHSAPSTTWLEPGPEMTGSLHAATDQTSLTGLGSLSHTHSLSSSLLACLPRAHQVDAATNNSRSGSSQPGRPDARRTCCWSLSPAPSLPPFPRRATGGRWVGLSQTGQQCMHLFHDHFSGDNCCHVSSMEQPRVKPRVNCSTPPASATRLMTDPDCWHWRAHTQALPVSHTHSHPLATLEAMLHLARHSSAAPSPKQRPVIVDQRSVPVVLLPQSSCSLTTYFSCCHGLFVLSYSPFCLLQLCLLFPFAAAPHPVHTFSQLSLFVRRPSLPPS